MAPVQAVAKPAAPVAAKGQAAPAVKPKVADNQTALLALLKVEAEVRDADSVRDLILLMANETRKLTRARQIFVVMSGVGKAFEVQGVSSIPVVDRSAPLIIFVERLVRSAAKSKALNAIHVLKMPPAGTDSVADSYPFRELVWMPLKHKGGALRGGLVLAREQAWSDQDLVIAGRLSAAFAHALQALRGPDRNFARKLLTLSRWHAGVTVALLAALSLVRVPLSALAPAEIVARDPFVVAAPIDGVIEAIEVDPSHAVKKGDLLVKLADTTLRNRFEVASREVQVAEARLKQSNQIAFSDPRGMHEIGIARAELGLKIAERDFARELLEKSEIRAQRDGIAMYSDKRDLLGRPVAVGERILEVADAQLDETGYLEDDPAAVIRGDVSLTQNDIRAVQLAKSAIHAGMRTLLKESGVSPDEVEELDVAGGFGSYLDIKNAVAIGLLPEELGDKVNVLGNAALGGASMILLSGGLRAACEERTKRISLVNLASNPVFTSEYMERMMF